MRPGVTRAVEGGRDEHHLHDEVWNPAFDCTRQTFSSVSHVEYLKVHVSIITMSVHGTLNRATVSGGASFVDAADLSMEGKGLPSFQDN